ncbi:MAG TPA: 2-hydroxyacyl-CoA dehydratase family protein [Terriglobia bacterium]|nr:2-hydroxyacyl-CoA dehydratase family protein [Terriglobia bacterium]
MNGFTGSALTRKPRVRVCADAQPSSENHPERIAGVTSNTVPWEILRAAGYAPRLLEDEPGPTPYADRFMEDVFERRTRVIFDRLCSGAWSELDLVVISRTSEEEHKLFLYLREASRLHYSDNIPELCFYNILHTRSDESFRYGLDRTRQMIHDLDVPENRLRDAIVESNRARAAIREIIQWREAGRLEGSVAIEMIRGFYRDDRGRFAENARAQLQNNRLPHATTRPRILIKGALLDHTALHRLLERHGAYVVAEDDWRGSRAAGDRDIREDGDAAVAIFEKYFYDAVSPRIQPFHEADAWFRRQIEHGRVDGVLFYVPEHDVAGWDYPRHLDFLRARAVPSLLVRDSGSPEPNAELTARVSTFIQTLERR